MTFDITAQPVGALQGVMFDMDGLLVDTESLWFAVEAATVAELGCHFGPQHAAEVVGGPLDRTVRYMIDVCGVDISPAELAARLVTGMVTALRTGVVLQPGAKALLAEVAEAGLPRALVSSSYRVMMDAVLHVVGRHYFPVTVAGDEVSELKPSPEPYLIAAARLGVDPTCCVVLEDSPPGVAAAEAAGCLTIAVPSLVPIPAVRGRVLVDSLEQLSLTRLRSLFAARACRGPTRW